jgi:hypothetical protein
LTTVDASDTRRSAQATFVAAGQRATLNLLSYRDVYPASRTIIRRVTDGAGTRNLSVAQSDITSYSPS